MPLPGAENEGSKKPKFEKDFIVLSEFSEQVGPIPIQVIPNPHAAGNFDTSQFSVRIMTTDFQSTSGGFSISEDTQSIVSEKQDNVFAYVHYFCLNDIHARGYVRQFCISYITSSLIKLTDNFECLLQHFSEVTRLLKCGNHRVFGKDLEHHLADLEHTLSLLENEGWMEEEDDKTAKQYLYEGFDFSSENVPERDPVVVKGNIEETKSIMETMKEEMHSEANVKVQLFLERRRSAYQKLQQQKEENIYSSRKESGFTSYVPSLMESVDYGYPDNSLSDSLSDVSVSSEMSHYEPQRVMAHCVHKFERRLRSLEDLSSKSYQAAMEKLKEICKLYGRTEVALAMEQEECLLLDPYSSLLTVGRVPMMNVLPDFGLRVSQSTPFLCPPPYRLSCKNTWAQPFEPMGLMSSDHDEDWEDQGAICSGFDTTFLDESQLLLRWPLYLDAVFDSRRSDSRQSDFRQSDSFQFTDEYNTSMMSTDAPLDGLPPPSQSHEGEGGSPESTAYNTPQVFRTPETGISPQLSIEEEEERVEVHGGGEDGVSSQVDLDMGVDRTGQTQIQVTSDKEASKQDRSPANHTTSDNRKNPKKTHEPSSSSVQNSFHDSTLNGAQACNEDFTDGYGRDLISINSDHPMEVYSSSQGSWEILINQNAKSEPINSEHQHKATAQNYKLKEEDIAAGLGQLENSYNAHQHHFNSHMKAQKLSPGESPLLHTRKHSSPKENGILPGAKYLGSGNGVATNGVGEDSPWKLPPPNLQLKMSPKKHPSPEFYSPVAAGSLRFSGSITSPLSPLSPGLRSIGSLLERTRWPPLIELRGKCKLPFVSSVDHIEGDYKFKPGRGILNFCNNNANAKDLLYCLLHGRPLVILGQEKDEGLIRRLVRALWVFLPGQSSRHQVIPWQTTPLDIKDLSKVKLIGLCSQSANWPGPHLRRYISYWDCTTEKMFTPPYNGDLLKSIVMRTKDRKNEQVFLTHIHSVLLDMAMRAYVYYHAYCISNKKSRQRKVSSSEAAPRKFHTVTVESPRKKRLQFLQQQLGIKSSDADIIEYFVEVIREQQLLEWKGEGGEQSDCSIQLMLHTKNCAESFCKPKRPY